MLGRLMAYTPQRLPVAPLRDMIRAYAVVRSKGAPDSSCSDGVTALWPRGSWQYRAWERAKSDDTITVSAADKLAIALGLHPALIWGELWWELPDIPTAGVRRSA